MSLRPSDLRSIPLFQDITDEHLEQLLSVFERVALDTGDVLFEAGEYPTHLLLLTSGEVELKEDGDVRFRLRPVAPIGELGALTGIRRNTTAVAAQPCEVMRVGTTELLEFFEAHGDVAFPFYHNLLRVVADKVRRDEKRLTEMRTNLIRTQKAMKKLRDLVLESEDTVLSKPVYETLEELIEHNRRWNYLVEPGQTLFANVRLDDGSLLPVLEMSAHFVRIPLPTDKPPQAGSFWSGVLMLPNGEIPVSGTVDSVQAQSAVVQLDMQIESYQSVLEEYLTRVQLLDFVV